MSIKPSRKWAFLIPVVLLVLGMLLLGCGKNLTISEGGSTTVQPLAQALADAFHAKNPSVTIDVKGGGTGAGISGANDGTLDIGAASRDLKSTEPQLVPFLLAKDAIAIIVKSDNPVVSLSAGLTKEQAVSIFSGSITHWSQVDPSLPNDTIRVYVRESGSGTRDAFQTLVMGSENITTGAFGAQSSGEMKQKVGSDSNGIGFESMAYVTGDTIKALTIDGMVPTVDNARNGTYTLVRPLYFLTKEQPTGIVKDFIDYCLSSEGQKVVADNGYIAIS